MKLVEVIPDRGTAAGALADLIAFVERIGKTPVVVKDNRASS
jgi:3-hydroxyacyl-CoA dehydrogenase